MCRARPRPDFIFRWGLRNAFRRLQFYFSASRLKKNCQRNRKTFSQNRVLPPADAKRPC
jgi:hypothetical protein